MSDEAGRTMTDRFALRGRVRMDHRVSLAGIFVACLLVGAGCGSGGSKEPNARDSELVWCLHADNEPKLVEAGVALGLVTAEPEKARVRIAGQDLSVAEWRDQRPQAFTRACRAAIGAFDPRTSGDDSGKANSGDSPLLTAILALLVSVLTAIVGGIVTSRLNAAGRLRQLLDEIQGRVDLVEASGAAYFDSFDGGNRRQDPKALFKAMSELDQSLKRVTVFHPTWRSVQILRTRWLAAPLDEELDRKLSWKDKDHDQLLREARSELIERVALTRRLTTQMQAPWRNGLRLRSGLPAPTPAAMADRAGV